MGLVHTNFNLLCRGGGGMVGRQFDVRVVHCYVNRLLHDASCTNVI